MEKDKIIDVSICCATYNQEKYIGRAIDSFLNQITDEINVEIIIHDDCSTDGTQKILKEYASKYKNIKLILQSENRFSRGLKIIPVFPEIALGKYIAFCEGDDYWTDKFKIKKQYLYMEEHSDCTLCSHAAVKVDETGNYLSDYCIQETDMNFYLRDIVLSDGNFLPTHSLFYRKNDIKKLPEVYLNCPIGDYPLQIYLTEKGYCHHINTKMGAYTVGSIGSLTTKLYKNYDNTISLRKSILTMLHEFNILYNYKYNDIFKLAIKENEFYIAELYADLKLLLSPKFRKMFKSEPMKKKGAIILRHFAPNIYRRIRLHVK